jgi:hypothetical protein
VSPTTTIVVAIVIWVVLVLPTYFLLDRWFKKRGDDDWGGPPG